MAKRFTDTDKWKKTWFRKLRPMYKVFWSYICDNCDNAGIWEVDFELAEGFVGEQLNPVELTAFFAKQIHSFHNGRRWFILDFIQFQYGDLKDTNNAHRSVLSILNRHHLLFVYQEYLLSQYENPGAGQGLPSPSQGAQDKDKDQTQDKDLERKRSPEEKPKLPVSSPEAVAHSAFRKANREGPSQPEYDRALKVLEAYPKRARRDGRIIKKDLAAQNQLARKIFDSPDFPWEEAAALEAHGDTPQDLGVWVMAMPDPIKLSAMRDAVATPIPPKPGERQTKKAVTDTTAVDFYRNFNSERA